VTNNHFEPGAYTNTTKVFSSYDWQWINTTGNEYGGTGHPRDSHDIQLFTSMLEGYNSSTPNYENLTPSQCTNLYKTDFVSSHRNLFLITKTASDATHNNTLLDFWTVDSRSISPSQWMCQRSPGHSSKCDANEFASNVASGVPWIVSYAGVEAEVSGCKSEITKEKCKVHFSLGIMIVVIACNLVKACSMITTLVRSREPTLVTLGDAVDSFLRIPDLTTMGICFADRRFIEREWRRGWRTGPRQWKQKKVQRWWASVSKTRWITCNFCFAITIAVSAVLLRLGILNDATVLKTDIKSM